MEASLNSSNRVERYDEHGKVTDIKAFDEQGEKLAEEYRNMIANAVKNPKNLPLLLW